jgi:hypothetical protein
VEYEEGTVVARWADGFDFALLLAGPVDLSPASWLPISKPQSGSGK